MRPANPYAPGGELYRALAALHTSKVPEPLRLYVLNRDGHICAYCGRFANQVDHRDPASRGGLTIAANLTACCGDCNRRKGARTLAEWQRDEARKRALAARFAPALEALQPTLAAPPLRLVIKKRPRARSVASGPSHNFFPVRQKITPRRPT